MNPGLLKKLRIQNLVTFSRGNIPVLLTVPHGGRQKPVDIPRERVEEKGYKTRSTEVFCTETGENTYELAWKLADRLKEKIGESPYVVAADFNRKYIDADRNSNLLGLYEVPYENHAYDDPAGQKYYEQYHDKIREFVEDIKRRFPGEGLLFDIHGSVLKNNKIVVGMATYDPIDFQRNFRRGHVSVDSLIARYGLNPLYHPTSGFLTALHGKPLPGGIQTEVVPLCRFERVSLSGGFTVVTYGSNRLSGINAFHLECSQKLRSQWSNHTVEIFAEAIHILYRNVIDAPFMLHTVFVGKKSLGNTRDGDAITSAAFEFNLNHSPKKGYPAVINIHTRRVKGSRNPVTLNDRLLGYLKPDRPLSVFETDNKEWGELKKKNRLIISLEARPTDGFHCHPPVGGGKKPMQDFLPMGEGFSDGFLATAENNKKGEEEFDILKIDLLCCCP